MLDIIKNNYKKILITLVVLASIPLLGVVTKVIYAYGEVVGTYARQVVEEGICR